MHAIASFHTTFLGQLGRQVKGKYSLKTKVQNAKIKVGKGLCCLTGWGLGKYSHWWNSNSAKYLLCRTFQCSGKNDVLQHRELVFKHSRPQNLEQFAGRMIVRQIQQSSISNVETPNIFQTLFQHVSLLAVSAVQSWYNHNSVHWEKPPVPCFIPLFLPRGAP